MLMCEGTKKINKRFTQQCRVPQLPPPEQWSDAVDRFYPAPAWSLCGRWPAFNQTLIGCEPLQTQVTSRHSARLTSVQIEPMTRDLSAHAVSHLLPSLLWLLKCLNLRLPLNPNHTQSSSYVHIIEWGGFSQKLNSTTKIILFTEHP